MAFPVERFVERQLVGAGWIVWDDGGGPGSGDGGTEVIRVWTRRRRERWRAGHPCQKIAQLHILSCPTAIPRFEWKSVIHVGAQHDDPDATDALQRSDDSGAARTFRDFDEAEGA